MASTTPSASNGYAVDIGTLLDVPTVGAILSSLHGRLNALEALIVTWEAAVAQVQSTALNQVALNIGPQIQAQRDLLTALQNEIALAEDHLATLLGGGVEATNVTYTPGGTVAATNLQAALRELDDDTQAQFAALPTTLAAAFYNKAAADGRFAPLSAVLKVNSATTAAAFQSLIVDTSAAAVTVTLPATPAEGQWVVLGRRGANAVTVLRNGQSIEGVAQDLVMDIDKANIRLSYDAGTASWYLGD